MTRSGLMRCGLLAGALLLPGPTAAQDDVAAMLRAGDYEGARAVAQATLDRSPEDPRAWRRLGDALGAVGEREAALDAYASALVHGIEDRLAVRLAAARIRLERESGAALRAELEAIRDGFTGESSQSSSDLAAVAGATRLLAVGRPALFREAVRIYGLAVERDGANLKARTELGDLLLEKYNSREAIEVYGEVLAIDDGYPPALLGMARAAYFDGAPQAAAALDRALELNPNLVPALLLRARMLLDIDELEAATDAVDNALGVNPGSAAALGMRAAIAYKADEPARVGEIVARIGAMAPGRADPFITLAEVAAQSRRYADAVRFAWYGVDADPTAWQARGILGLNELRTGDVRAGRDNLERAFRGDPFNVWFKNTLDLLDATADFVELRTPSFNVLIDPAEAEVLGPYLTEEAEAAYRHFAERYDYRPPTPVRLEVYSRAEDLSVRTVGLLGVDILGVSFGPVVAMDSPSTGAGGGFNWAAVVWHELAHTFHLGITGNRATRWFSEGLAVHEEHRARPGWGADPTPDFVAAWVEGKLPHLSALEPAFVRPSYPGQVQHAYYHASMVVAVIERDFGVEGLRAMLQAFAGSVDTEEVVQQALGITVDELDRRFVEHIESVLGHARLAMTTPPGGDAPPYAVAMRAGVAAARAGDDERAEAALLEAQAMFPDYAGGDSPYAVLARIYQRQGRHDEAIEQLRRMVDIDADALQPHLELGGLLMARGSHEQAAAVLERALRVDPFDLRVHQQLAAIYERLEDWPAAAREHGVVVALDAPDPVDSRYRYARALHLAGAGPKARREVLRALERAPLYEPALELLLEITE